MTKYLIKYILIVNFSGFAKSSRFTFSKDPEICEKEFTSIIEKWREKMDLEMFNICGHSFGGYIASLYSLQYPER